MVAIRTNKLTMKIKSVLFFLMGAFAFISCTKEPGVGGSATISGKLHAIYVEEGSFDTLETSAFPDQRVYIIYGDGSTQDDDTRTSPDGSFKFQFLNPGDYSIYSYSETLTHPSGTTPIYVNTNVGKKQDDVNVGVIEVIKYVK